MLPQFALLWMLTPALNAPRPPAQIVKPSPVTALPAPAPAKKRKRCSRFLSKLADAGEFWVISMTQ